MGMVPKMVMKNMNMMIDGGDGELNPNGFTLFQRQLAKNSDSGTIEGEMSQIKSTNDKGL